MMKIDKSFSKLKVNVSLFAVLIVTVFGCAKKEISVSNTYEIQKQRSLELESPKLNGPVVNQESTVEASASAVTPVENLKSIEKDLVTPISVTSAKSTKEVKSNVRIEKLKKIIEKKTSRIQKKMENAKTNALNNNIKIGLILILIGILIAVLLGNLVNGPVFGAIGTIIAVIGIVFLILGLLEM